MSAKRVRARTEPADPAEYAIELAPPPRRKVSVKTEHTDFTVDVHITKEEVDKIEKLQKLEDMTVSELQQSCASDLKIEEQTKFENMTVAELQQSAASDLTKMRGQLQEVMQRVPLTTLRPTPPSTEPPLWLIEPEYADVPQHVQEQLQQQELQQQELQQQQQHVGLQKRAAPRTPDRAPQHVREQQELQQQHWEQQSSTWTEPCNDIENVPYTLRPDAALRGVWENSATPKAGWLSTLDGRLQNQMVRLKSNGQAYVSDIQRLHLTTLPRHRGRGLATFGRSSKHTGDSSARPLLPPPPPPAAAAGGGSGSRDVWHGGGPTAPPRLRTPARSRSRRGAGPAVKKPSSPKPAAEKSKTTKSTAPSRLRTPARSRSRRGARPAVMFLY